VNGLPPLPKNIRQEYSLNEVFNQEANKGNVLPYRKIGF